jgi:hypothetical protein
LNEIDHEFGSIEEYTRIYDSVVTNIRKLGGLDHLQFMGLALAGNRDLGFNDTYFSYFLNRTNHSPQDVPLDWISYHYYSHPPDRTNVTEYEQFFDSVDLFLIHLSEIEEIRQALSPETRVALNEIGVILPGDNDANVSSYYPPIFVNAASAVYAYMFAHVTPLDIYQIGNSQFLGFPNMPQLGLTNQYPSLAIVNWTDGSPTARFRAIELLQESFYVGDTIVHVITTDPFERFICASAYESPDRQIRRLLLVNKRMIDIDVTVRGANGGFIRSIDESTGTNPARIERLNSDRFTLHPFSVSVVEFLRR